MMPQAGIHAETYYYYYYLPKKRWLDTKEEGRRRVRRAALCALGVLVVVVVVAGLPGYTLRTRIPSVPPGIPVQLRRRGRSYLNGRRRRKTDRCRLRRPSFGRRRSRTSAEI